MTCLREDHIAVPDIKHCSQCRKEYEEYLLKHFGEKAVQSFRKDMQQEMIREKIRP